MMSGGAADKMDRLQADLVIVGAGGAGMAAAIAALEKGCSSVMLLEKAGAPGGSTAMAHDIFAVESPVQKRAWFDTSKDEIFRTHMDWTHWTVDPRIVRVCIDRSADTIRWLEEKGMGFELLPMYPNQAPLIRHALKGRGRELCRILREDAEDRGAKLLTRTRARSLARAESGEVTGVIADTRAGEVTIEAGAVIITTGGYGNNKGMLRQYYPYYHDTMTYDGPPANTGDGILLATEIGADTAGLGAMNLHGPSSAPRSPDELLDIDGATDAHGKPLKLTLMPLCLEPDTMWVNRLGRRYIDEGYILQFFAYGHAVARQPDGVSFTLFDSESLRAKEREGIFAQMAPGWSPPDTWVCGRPLPGLERELQKPRAVVKCSDSWEEIASWIGADPTALRASVDEYNAGCDQGHDPLFAKARRYLRPLRTPPYYAILGHVHICDTVGGIRIDERMQVLDTSGLPIPGLYAAGVTTGGWEAETYDYKLTGHLVGFSINGGRIAGESAVAYLER
jgi:succinate dehydrogenase/fumarate reductase flavoprotein subunit